MLTQIATLLVDAIGTFFVFLLLARFHFQWLRVPFRNQIGQFVIATTNWAVQPLRRVIPGLVGLDLATLLAAFLLQLLTLWLLFQIAGRDPGLGLLAGRAAIDLLRYSLYILGFAVVMQALLSWINPHSPAEPVLAAVTSPFLRPLRRMVPPISNFDLTPAILMLVILVALILVNGLYGLLA